jgi:hypothetical protein
MIFLYWALNPCRSMATIMLPQNLLVSVEVVKAKVAIKLTPRFIVIFVTAERELTPTTSFISTAENRKCPMSL